VGPRPVEAWTSESDRHQTVQVRVKPRHRNGLELLYGVLIVSSHLYIDVSLEMGRYDGRSLPGICGLAMPRLCLGPIVPATVRCSALLNQLSWVMNEQLHPTPTVWASPSLRPGTAADRSRSCSFDLGAPLLRSATAETVNDWDARTHEPELVAGPASVGDPELDIESELAIESEAVVESESIAEPEWAAEPELIGEPESVAEPDLATDVTQPRSTVRAKTLSMDFVNLIAARPNAAPGSQPAVSDRWTIPAVSPFITVASNEPQSAPEAPAPKPAPSIVEALPGSNADRVPTRIPSRDLLLQLPKFKAARISSHRHRTNPALSLGILEDIGRVVHQWREEIDGIHQKIKALYGEGPILEAWLESVEVDGSTTKVSPEAMSSESMGSESLGPEAVGSKGVGSKAMGPEAGPELNPSNPVRNSELEPEGIASISPEIQAPRSATARKLYWLCGLDEEGQSWRHLCNQRDLPQITIAIARYQTLRQLLNQKQHREQQLTQLAKTLTVLRGRLRA
jgi:hypothetical protein